MARRKRKYTLYMSTYDMKSIYTLMAEKEKQVIDAALDTLNGTPRGPNRRLSIRSDKEDTAAITLFTMATKTAD